ncbi:MAG: ATP-binding protein [Oscillospiraceae bacterium]
MIFIKKLLSLSRAAIDKYNMIEDGDKIAIGVSGGKDSIALLYAMARLSKFYPKKFEIVAITLDPMFLNKECDYSKISDLCSELGVDYHIKRTELYKVIFEIRNEKNPCSLCAKMRRGILHDAAKELGCNKIALGHHLDDAAETFIMNLFNGGKIGCFSPVSYLSHKDLTMIRPMIFLHEKDIVRVSQKYDFPIVKSKCPADGVTERQNTKELLNSLEKTYPALREKIIGAMQRNKIDKW